MYGLWGYLLKAKALAPINAGRVPDGGLYLKEIFHDSFEVFYKDLYGKPCKRDWMAKVVFLMQMLLTFGGRCNPYF